MRLLICYGTRPEYIKVKPLIKRLERSYANFGTLYIAQHKDLIGEHHPDRSLVLGDSSNCGRLNNIFSQVVKYGEDEITKHGYTHILVQGDTAAAAAMALCAFNAKIPVIHLEAGLRTYDKENPYPEETYRQIISKIADIHLCPTLSNYNNLIKEQTIGQIHVVGNTSLDNIVDVQPHYGNQILVTLHRRENHEIISEYFSEISKLALQHKDIDFILPIHSNPNVLKYKELLKGVRVTTPLDHATTIHLLKNCKFCITDSGGLQEEASFLQKKCIVCRKTTERTEGIGLFFYLCPDPKNLSTVFDMVNKDFFIKQSCPFGDGKSSEKIIKILWGLK